MNRIQSLELDPISSRPLTAKNLPPVRKFGAGGGRPPSSIGGRLGPIGGPLPPPTNRLDDHLSLNNNINESLSDLTKELDAYDREQDNYGLPPPSSRMVKKPSSPSGLLLTGMFHYPSFLSFNYIGQIPSKSFFSKSLFNF
jgi:hypothetical protein